MPLLAGVCPLPSIVSSISAQHTRLARQRPVVRATAALALALLVVACDREKAPEPQPKEISSPSKPSDAATPQRYRIDLSGAGSKIPAISLTGPDGKPRDLASLEGKPVLLNLWATWCAPCIEELPTINAVARDAGTLAHVVALSQDIGGDGSGPRSFLNERGWSSVQAWHDPDNEIGLTVGGQLPTTIIYDATGREVGRVIGPLDWNGTEAREMLSRAGFPDRD